MSSASSSKIAASCSHPSRPLPGGTTVGSDAAVIANLTACQGRHKLKTPELFNSVTGILWRQYYEADSGKSPIICITIVRREYLDLLFPQSCPNVCLQVWRAQWRYHMLLLFAEYFHIRKFPGETGHEEFFHRHLEFTFPYLTENVLSKMNDALNAFDI